MAKAKKASSNTQVNLPVTKQTAGGVTGAVIGGVIAGPVGAVIGGVAGAMMGNRAAQGKPLVSSGTVDAVKTAATNVKDKVSGVKPVKKMIANVKKAVPHAGSLPKAKSLKAKPSAKPKAVVKSSSKKKAAPKKK